MKSPERIARDESSAEGRPSVGKGASGRTNKCDHACERRRVGEPAPREAPTPPSSTIVIFFLSFALSLPVLALDEAGPFAEARERMVREQLIARGIRGETVLRAMEKVPRHLFVPEFLRYAAYLDGPLSIGEGQTISQPYIVALMTELLELKGTEKVLEIGTGSGYQAAILAELVPEVFTIEIIPSLAERASQTLRDFGYSNVHVRTGNGYLGWPEEAPFDAIIVTAAPEFIPQALVAQLKEGGILVIPMGPSGHQFLWQIRKSPTGLKKKTVLPVRFVPMVEPVR